MTDDYLSDIAMKRMGLALELLDQLYDWSAKTVMMIALVAFLAPLAIFLAVMYFIYYLTAAMTPMSVYEARDSKVSVAVVNCWLVLSLVFSALVAIPFYLFLWLVAGKWQLHTQGMPDLRLGR